jgi:hypothetical protein
MDRLRAWLLAMVPPLQRTQEAPKLVTPGGIVQHEHNKLARAAAFSEAGESMAEACGQGRIRL